MHPGFEASLGIQNLININLALGIDTLHRLIPEKSIGTQEINIHFSLYDSALPLLKFLQTWVATAAHRMFTKVVQLANQPWEEEEEGKGNECARARCPTAD